MKQIDEMFQRFIDRKPPKKHKWQIRQYLYLGRPVLLFAHYQHIIAIYHVDSKTYLRQWYETDTDKRGLDAIVRYLDEHGDIVAKYSKDVLPEYKIKAVFEPF